MTLEGDLKDTLQSVKKKEEHPFCDFVINIGVNVCQSTLTFKVKRTVGCTSHVFPVFMGCGYSHRCSVVT